MTKTKVAPSYLGHGVVSNISNLERFRITAHVASVK